MVQLSHNKSIIISDIFLIYIHNSFLMMKNIVVIALLLFTITQALYTSSFWQNQGINVRD
jgi:hypothetical protein